MNIFEEYSYLREGNIIFVCSEYNIIKFMLDIGVGFKPETALPYTIFRELIWGKYLVYGSFNNGFPYQLRSLTKKGVLIRYNSKIKDKYHIDINFTPVYPNQKHYHYYFNPIFLKGTENFDYDNHIEIYKDIYKRG